MKRGLDVDDDDDNDSYETILQHELELMQANVVPIKRRHVPQNERDLPDIVNVVSTVILLPQRTDLPPHQRYKLPLGAITARLGCSQYAPVLFAANILKLKDSQADVTALIFATGKVVLVAALSMGHTRYICQLVRVIIEQVQCALYDAETQQIHIGTLCGRTIFQDCSLHNIVGNANLNCRIDLQAMCDAAPTACKWDPDNFPGLKCRIWLTDTHTCHCKGKRQTHAELQAAVGKTSKCVCVLKVLVFDTGQLVITGGHSVEDVNSVYFRIKALAPRYEHTKNVIPRESRFYQRLSSMLVNTARRQKSTQRTQVHEPGHMKEGEAIAMLMNDVSQPLSLHGAAAVKKQNTGGTTMLMQLAEEGRVEEVIGLLLYDPDQCDLRDSAGQTALQRLQQIPEPEQTVGHRRIMELLCENKKK
jgi:TATA-box binding protein (TBP) (component of TFIID and TFIIIB)